MTNLEFALEAMRNQWDIYGTNNENADEDWSLVAFDIGAYGDTFEFMDIMPFSSDRNLAYLSANRRCNFYKVANLDMQLMIVPNLQERRNTLEEIFVGGVR